MLQIFALEINLKCSQASRFGPEDINPNLLFDAKLNLWYLFKPCVKWNEATKNLGIEQLYLGIDSFIWITCSHSAQKVLLSLSYQLMSLVIIVTSSHLRVRFWTQFWQLTSNKPASRLFSLWTVFLGFNQHFVTVLKGSGLIVGAAHYCVLPVIFTRVGSKNSRRGLPGLMFDVGNTTQKVWRSLQCVSWDRPANSTT